MPFRLTTLAFLLSTPAFAGGPVWEEMIGEKDPGLRLFGALGACITAVHDPVRTETALTAAGWQPEEAEEGAIGYGTETLWLMFWREPGFCMLESTDFTTETLAKFLAEFDIKPSGTDADGCTQFAIEDTIATLTGGGNDPACTSTTEAALRFEPAS
jgi:hypothetical protein